MYSINFAVMYFQTPIAQLCCSRSVGHRNTGTVGQASQAIQHLLFRIRIQSTGTLVQQQNRRTAQYSSRNSQSLCLTFGQPRTALQA